jgi:uncharacterized protein with WD repeat
MPAKATIFNKKCEPVFDFGTGPRNMALYNPQGSILMLAGFGNLVLIFLIFRFGQNVSGHILILHLWTKSIHILLG